MRGKIRGVLLALAVTMLCACDSFSLHKPFTNEKDYVDSTFVAEYFDECINPAMLTATEAVIYQAQLIDEMSIENVFTSMPQDVLINVATVCIRKYGNATKADIVAEYQKNYSVYNNLPGSEVKEYKPLTSPDTLPAKATNDTVKIEIQ